MTKQEAKQKLNSLKRIRVATDVDGWEYYDANEDVQKCLDIAIECIEKQIPKKPIHKHKNYYCPTCKDDTWILWDDAIPNEVDNFCPICGQAIDWSGNE